MRPDGLRPRPRRQLPLVPVRRAPRATPAPARPPGDLGDEPDRRRRQDHPGRGCRGDRHRRPRRPLDRPLPGRRADPPDDPAGRPAPGDRAHSRDGRARRTPPRGRARLPDRGGLDLLPDCELARLRAPGPARSRPAARRRARGRRRVCQGRCSRLRAVEGSQGRRACLGDGDRIRAPGLAPRVLGDGDAVSRRVVRRPHRRRGPRLPAPRGRDRPVRGGDREALRADVAPLRPPPDGRTKDGQVGGQHHPRHGAPRGGRLAPRGALRAAGGALPDRAQLQRRVGGGRSRRGRSPGRPGCGARGVSRRRTRRP